MKIHKWGLFVITCILLCAALWPASAYASVKYSTYTKDSRGNLIWLQPSYFPLGVIGQNLTATDPASKALISSPMKNPKDIFIDAKGEVYIADTGNNRLVHMTETGKLLRYITLPDNPFNKPEGVFVTGDGSIYVADTGNKRVLKLDASGKLVQEYKRPESRYIPETFVFDPAKVMVDEREFMYVAVHGSYEGLVMIDPKGKFQGFFGANNTALSPLDALKRMLYTKTMYANEVAKRPEPINSVATDKNGYIFTVTGGTATTNQLKKLNVKGDNLLRGSSKPFGETAPWDVPAEGVVTGPQLSDVAVDQSGNMIVVDQQNKYISHYDASGNLLYFWGGASAIGSSQVGLLKSPVALDVNSRNELFVLDDQENIVQVFRLSEFGQKVDQANQLTLAGRYEDSEQPWKEVLRLNGQFAPAYLGLAKSAFKKEQYEVAKDLFKEAGDQQGYSDSFWQIRMLWLQQNFSWIASVLVLGIILYIAADKMTANREFRTRWRNRPKSQNRFIANTRLVLHILKHPIDGFSAIHYENKGSYLSASVILLCVYASLIISQFVTSFSFNPKTFVDIYSTFTQFFIVWFAWIIANYLVSSIYRGEGRFKHIFIGSAYALLPYIAIGIPLAIVSNVMTMSESSIYQFMGNAMTVWIGLLIFWKIQNVHNYTFGETIMNIFLTICTMLVIGVLIFIIIGLTSDFGSLLYQMYQEVTLR
ncbi:YIP1 family protein [Paenibacillus sp. GCM10023248]|uniref:YIP1 family protein n=1 Tax=Bacillales TaxID=1385 RepID=UPI002379CB21|nr:MULTISPECIES: YIP1 family protein [Bacillales]MDD9269168.1 nuclease PIN [Paenibacillus sp. MAHUQ-63]MDR6880612.1 sugar lactone lactonase YvrE/tetratricopeptide (TPR) repeat protein [Bacillus sp. 3255]